MCGRQTAHDLQVLMQGNWDSEFVTKLIQPPPQAKIISTAIELQRYIKNSIVSEQRFPPS